jgi:hypothetical protein
MAGWMLASAAAIALVKRADVAIVGTGGAGKLLGVGRTVGARPGTVLRHVALAHRLTAYRRGRFKLISWTVVVHPVAALGDVTVAGR